MEMLRGDGCAITYDWTVAYSEERETEKALVERQGVRDAHVVVYLWESGQESARYEAGMAMGLGKPLDRGRPSEFLLRAPRGHLGGFG